MSSEPSRSVPSGYTLVEVFTTRSETAVVRATRDRDGAQVVLKSYHDDHDRLDESGAAHERAALDAAAGARVPRCLDLIEMPPARVLVLELVPGVDLEKWADDAPPIAALLEVAANVADVVECLHTGRIVHGDLTPTNILVDRETREVNLVDLGASRRLGIAARGPSRCSSSRIGVRTLEFIAPEQTGRMNRGVDARSDLYTLGATLYFLLTGKPPFDATDPLELIHAHMARVPLAPDARRSDLPEAVSRIVMRLLQKDPSDRYQSARTLARDLRLCSDALRQAGRIADDLEIGVGDFQSRPVFSDRLYGRESELAELEARFRRAVESGFECMLLSGPPGSGKSALVRELRVQIAKRQGYLLTGSFDRYRSKLPYAGFVQALGALAHQILVEDDCSIASWRAALRAGLGALTGVLVELAPDFAHVLGGADPVPSLGPREARARLALTLERLLQTCARQRRPIVLFLDCVQWSDPASQFLIDHLVASVREPGWMLVLAARTDEESNDGPTPEQRASALGVTCTHIVLAELGAEACAAMLGDALHCPPEHALALARCVVRRTGGNALAAQQFVIHLADTGHLHVKDESWFWDPADVERAEIPDGAAAILAEKIKRLDRGLRRTLECASCVGDEFDAHRLGILADEDDGIESRLFRLAEAGLLVPAQGGYRFAHSRIRDAAQALLPPERGRQLHAQMAWRLAESVAGRDLSAYAVEIADHLLYAGPPAAGDERRRTCDIYAAAGRRSLREGAAAAAARYLDAARDLLDADAWQRDGQAAFHLFMDSAECSLQVGELERALDVLAQLETRAPHDVARAQVIAKQIVVQSLLGRGDPVATTLSAAREFGQPVPRAPSWWRVWWEIWCTDRQLRGPLDPGRFASAPADATNRVHPALVVLEAGAPGIMRESARLMCVMAARGVRLLRAGAPIRSPARILASYAAFRAMYRRDLSDVDRLATAAEEWLHLRPEPVRDPRTQLILLAFLRGWTGPRRAVVAPLRELVFRAEEVGAVEDRTFAAVYAADYTALSGAPLGEVIGAFRDVRGMGFPLPGIDDGDRMHCVFYRCLHELPDSHEELQRRVDRIDACAADGSGLAAYWVGIIHWILVCVVRGELERAHAWAERILPRAERARTAGASLADYVLLRGIAAAGTAPRGWRGRRRRRIARICARQIRVWARHSPDCRDLAPLLDAEILRAQGRGDDAAMSYQTAADAGRRAQLWQYAALAEERAATLARAQSRPDEADRAILRAIGLYARWEAHAKVDALRRTRMRLP